MNIMENTINKNLLRHAAGSAIFCPNCQSIMDWQKTVIGSLYVIQGTDPEKLVKSYVSCCKCWDSKGWAVVTNGVEVFNEKMIGKATARLEIVDGRDYKPAKRTRKPKASKPAIIDPEALLEAAESGESIGFCKACGNEQQGCEPDARGYKCDRCGEHQVYGAEELIMMGHAD